jgi:hypothetical protein
MPVMYAGPYMAIITQVWRTQNSHNTSKVWRPLYNHYKSFGSPQKSHYDSEVMRVTKLVRYGGVNIAIIQVRNGGDFFAFVIVAPSHYTRQE